jgi:hypothetical protein
MSDDKPIRDDFEQRTKQLFDASVAGLDAATRSQLNRARHGALEQRPVAHAPWWRWPVLPAGSVAAAAVLAALLFVHPRVPNEPGLQGSTPGDLEILLGDEELQMLDEDIEFYGWLEQQPEIRKGSDGVD